MLRNVQYVTTKNISFYRNLTGSNVCVVVNCMMEALDNDDR
jgi:hypothetical protein